jgi:hypothetical protein
MGQRSEIGSARVFAENPGRPRTAENRLRAPAILSRREKQGGSCTICIFERSERKPTAGTRYAARYPHAIDFQILR